MTKVLVVDDEEVSRYLVRQLLPRGPYDIAEATSATDAIAQAERYRPDVVLFDINMPKVDGYDLLALMGNDTTLSKVPAVAFTANALPEVDGARLRGAARVLSKFDLTTETLVATIREVTAKVAQ